jgi:hypothetical protein
VTIAPRVGTTYYLAPAADGGKDSNNGLAPGAPWLTPNHALNCGDVIIAAPSTMYQESNFNWNSFGTINCPAGNNVAWLWCQTFDGCKISVPSDQPDYSGGIDIDKDYWGVEGWEVDSASMTAGPCFQANPGAVPTTTIHHIIFANDIAVGCGEGGFQAGPNGLIGVDYFAVVGSIAYNTGGSPIECYSGFDVFGPVASDSLPGTHIYVGGNFGWGIVNPNPCGGAVPTDGEGAIFDTFQSIDSNPYGQQAVIDNSVFVFNGGRGVHVYDNASVPHASIFVRHVTAYANSQGNDYNIACGEIALQNTLSTQAFGNLAETAGGLTCHGGANAYVFSVSQTIDSSDRIYSNFGYSAAGDNTTGTGTGFSFGPNNTFSNPQLASPVEPGPPNCSNYSSVPACMAQVIADFTPTNPAAAGYGYQIPSSTSVYDPLFPQWLCNVNLPAGLVSMGCKAAP